MALDNSFNNVSSRYHLMCYLVALVCHGKDDEAIRLGDTLSSFKSKFLPNQRAFPRMKGRSFFLSPLTFARSETT
jgi:hypothetical protein